MQGLWLESLEQMCHVVQSRMRTCMRLIRILMLGRGKHACALLRFDFFFMHIRDTRPYSSAKQHVICIGRPGGPRLA
jgi:hypothetical protein